MNPNHTLMWLSTDIELSRRVAASLTQQTQSNFGHQVQSGNGNSAHETTTSVVRAKQAEEDLYQQEWVLRNTQRELAETKVTSAPLIIG